MGRAAAGSPCCCYAIPIARFISLRAGPREGCDVGTLDYRGRLGCRIAEPSVLRIINVMMKIVALRRWLYFVAALRLLSGERSIITQQDPARGHT
jgi:hypothetical protein